MVNNAGGQLASLTCKTPNRVCDFLISIFFSECDFCAIDPLYFYSIRKSFVIISQQFSMTKRRQAFLALWFWKKKKVLN